NELEQGLARARSAIRKAVSMKNHSEFMAKNGISFPEIYRNPLAFIQSYKEMEKRLRVYVYREGELPMVHDGPCKDIYAIEGRFIHEMERGGNGFRTTDPRSANLFFMPFSVTWMVKYLYTPGTYDLTPLREFVSGYVNLVAAEHPFWNRTQGADHFMLSCHDWGPHASRGNEFMFRRSIRVLCNANTSEGFDPRKDVALPEIYLYGGRVNPKLSIPPPPPSSRPHLAFFAGGIHGPIREALLRRWKDRDPDIKVTDRLTRPEEYYGYMLRSRYCLCPSGYEVASPRIVEAVYAECVPVILSDGYALPFGDVLRWEAFSVAADVAGLKERLGRVSEEEYRRLRMGVRAVRRHFVLNRPPERYDAFGMILHSLWLRRLNLRL
ncbi:hypothetical protein M569_07773, partial [Genlisea aurea]